jgi:transcriptional regulator with XRE-family HTH domain
MELHANVTPITPLRSALRAKGQAVTMFEVGEMAGVSKATVSMVLNNDPRITAATRQRVLAAVQALRYEVNESARALSLKRREKQFQAHQPVSLATTA